MSKKGAEFIQHSFQFRVGARIDHRWLEAAFVVDPEAQKLYQLGKSIGLIIPPDKSKNEIEDTFLSPTLHSALVNRLNRGLVRLLRRMAPAEVMMEIISDGLKQVSKDVFTIKREDAAPKVKFDKEKTETIVAEELDKQKAGAPS